MWKDLWKIIKSFVLTVYTLLFLDKCAGCGEYHLAVLSAHYESYIKMYCKKCARKMFNLQEK